MTEVSGYNPDMLIWVDETGSDRRNSIQNCGYALGGMRPVCHHLSVSDRHVSAITVMTTRGTEHVFATTDCVNGDVFERFTNVYSLSSSTLMVTISDLCW